MADGVSVRVSTVIFYHISLADLVDRSEQQHEVLPSYYYDTSG